VHWPWYWEVCHLLLDLLLLLDHLLVPLDLLLLLDHLPPVLPLRDLVQLVSIEYFSLKDQVCVFFLRYLICQC
jgi:hypothetical protein